MPLGRDNGAAKTEEPHVVPEIDIDGLLGRSDLLVYAWARTAAGRHR